MAKMKYEQFIESKNYGNIMSGFEPLWIPDFLYGFQKELTVWSLQKGKAALFEDCGLGKTPQQLVWAQNVVQKTNGKVLIITPLSVSHQTVREAKKFGLKINRTQDGTIKKGINITNYERLKLFNPNDFHGIVCDECFPPDTKIDVFNIDNTPITKYIKDIGRNDRIYNAFGVDNVKEIYKRKINRAVKICVNGKTITSSENHPFFTLHGWRSAQDIQTGDYLMETETAVQLVRGDIYPKVCSIKDAAVLRDILLSEMENECPRNKSENTQSRDEQKEGKGAVAVSKKWNTGSECSDRENTKTESYEQSRNKKESICYIAEDEAQTFRTWGKWSRDDIATANNEECTIRELDTGICYITGKTNTGFSNMLQNRLRQSRLENSNRDRRGKSLFEKETGRKKGQKAGFFRVESVEVLEQGHPQLEKYRDESGNIYFYDIKAKRHPSFSIGGILVHNSSILKNFDGKTRRFITDFLYNTPYRLLCTATPAPNDYMELGTSAEALGEMTRNQMLGMFFTNDGKNSQQWNLKGHARKRFWHWVSTWARAIRKPSDLGYKDKKFKLPKFNIAHHYIKSKYKDKSGMLLMPPAKTLQEQRRERNTTIKERCEFVKSLVPENKPFLIWCHLNNEADLLEKMIPDAVQVSGRDKDSVKESRLVDFALGNIQILITKPKIASFGMNWQHCADMSFFPSHSHEQFYQASRRCWRFGQKNEVNCHIVASERESMVVDNMIRKEHQANLMYDGIIREMTEFQLNKKEIKKETIKMELPKWI